MDREAALRRDIQRVEAAMDVVAPDKLPNLVREHRILLAELDNVPTTAQVSRADEIAKRRAARAARAKRTG